MHLEKFLPKHQNLSYQLKVDFHFCPMNVLTIVYRPMKKILAVQKMFMIQTQLSATVALNTLNVYLSITTLDMICQCVDGSNNTFGIMSDFEDAIALNTPTRGSIKIFIIQSSNSLISISLKNRFKFDFDGPISFIQSAQLCKFNHLPLSCIRI